jgi:hypothetical protein
MGARGTRSDSLKGAFQLAGRWSWIDRHGGLRTYRALPDVIAVASAEGWRFDHQVGGVIIFRGD